MKQLSICVTLALLASCATDADQRQIQNTIAQEDALLSAPQGIAAHARWIVVANSAFTWKNGGRQWGEGFVTLIDRNTRQIVSRIATTQRNPRDVAVVGDLAYVVDSGTFALDDDGLATATSDGGIDIIDLGTETAPRTVAANLALPVRNDDPRIGAYGSIAVSPNNRWAYVGSGTRGDLFMIDLIQQTVVRGPDNPIPVFDTQNGENGMTTVRRVGDRLVVLDFNSDAMCISDDWAGQLAQRTCQGIGVNDEFLEGPVDVAGTPSSGTQSNLLVLMTIANSVYRVSGGGEPFVVEPDHFTTGLASNRILVHDNFAYVVNSTSNNIERLHLDTAQWDLPFSAFAPGSNPFDMVVADDADESLAWVTLFGDNQIAVVALDSGVVTTLIGSESASDDILAPSTIRTCAEGAAQNVVAAQEVILATFGANAGHGQDAMPEIVLGGPQGAGSRTGATASVLSLGRSGEIVLGFGDCEIIDGPGPDLIVFENAFETSAYTSYAEPAFVGLSATGTDADDFVEFPCDPQQKAGDPENKIWPFTGCAGVHPVEANVLTNCVSPTDPQQAGGDAFDLGDLGLEHATYVRIRDAGVSACSAPTCGFDLDAVVVINADCSTAP